MVEQLRARGGLVGGLALVAAFSVVATWIAGLGPVRALSLSPLVIGILLGALFGNTLRPATPAALGEGVVFAAKKVLRLAIILYGFRITFQQVAEVGLPGLAADVFIVATTLTLGTIIGVRVFGLDRQMAVLTASGAAICGAAAVIATEPVVKASPEKTAAAVGTVVLFGTTAMFLYPAVWRTGLVPMSIGDFGIYIGATVHEVAHVVAAGNATGGVAADAAVIVKMTRVMLLAPALLVLGAVLNRGGGRASKVSIPWFAVGFIAVAAFNSLALLPGAVVDSVNVADTFLLTMAMTALGRDTTVAKLRGVGPGPLYLAATLFAWLIVSGFAVTKLVGAF